jgi:tetrahydromethanopterin S-methyltransferase subunit D
MTNDTHTVVWTSGLLGVFFGLVAAGLIWNAPAELRRAEHVLIGLLLAMAMLFMGIALLYSGHP